MSIRLVVFLGVVELSRGFALQTSVRSMTKIRPAHIRLGGQWNQRSGFHSRLALSHNVCSEDDVRSLYNSLARENDGNVNYAQLFSALSGARDQNMPNVTESTYTEPLQKDIELLTNTLGEIIKNENPAVYEVSQLSILILPTKSKKSLAN